MKVKHLLSMLMMILLLWSCKKQNNLSHQLEGEWELRTTISGMTGAQSSYHPGNGSLLKFKNEQYEVVENGKVIKQGRYQIDQYKSYLTGKEESRIVYDGQTNTVNSYFKIENDMLSIAVDANDGPAAIYARIK